MGDDRREPASRARAVFLRVQPDLGDINAGGFKRNTVKVSRSAQIEPCIRGILAYDA